VVVATATKEPTIQKEREAAAAALVESVVTPTLQQAAMVATLTFKVPRKATVLVAEEAKAVVTVR
tara:strand:- start:444 stop:638 length:195 start_codon:yes stop_codon:yes gene_type:complete